MIVDRILGNKHDLDPAELAGLHEEKIVLPSAELVKRVQRVSTDHGRDVGIRLTVPADLRDGDILYRDDDGFIAISVLPADVLVIAPRSVLEMGTVAHNLGNRHVQAQFFGAGSDYRAEVMVVAYDHTIEDYLTHAGVPFTRQQRVMPVPFRHAGHTH